MSAEARHRLPSEHTQSGHICPDHHEATFLGHYYGCDMYFRDQPTPALIFMEDGEETEFPYSIHRVIMPTLAIEDPHVGAQVRIELLKKLTLARLLADAMGLHKAELLIEVTQEVKKD